METIKFNIISTKPSLFYLHKYFASDDRGKIIHHYRKILGRCYSYNCSQQSFLVPKKGDCLQWGKEKYIYSTMMELHKMYLIMRHLTKPTYASPTHGVWDLWWIYFQDVVSLLYCVLIVIKERFAVSYSFCLSLSVSVISFFYINLSTTLSLASQEQA